MSKNLLSKFKSDPKKETEGIWCSYGKNDQGQDQAFLLARMSRSNKAYQKAMLEFGRKHERQLQAKTLDDDVAFEGMLDVFCRTILLDWRGIISEGGDPLPHSVEGAKVLMKDYPDLYQELEDLAKDRTLYVQDVVVEASGN